MITTEWPWHYSWLLLLPLLLLLLGHSFWLLSGFRRLLERQRDLLDAEQQPFISVIMAAHNEEPNLPATLQALAQLDYPADRVEFILVNDRSTDRTLQLMQSASSAHPNWQVISSTPSENYRGKVNALRCATEPAQGEFFLFLDADCVPPPNWLRSYGTLVSHCDVICGHIGTQSHRRSGWRRLVQLEHLYASLQVMAGSGQGNPLFSRGGNWGYSRALWESCGGWHGLSGRSWGDDILMMDRFRQLPGTRFGYATTAGVTTPPPASLREWWQRSRRRYGKVGQISFFSRLLHTLFYLVLILMMLLPLLLPQLLFPWLGYGFLALLTLHSTIRRGAALLNHTVPPATLWLFLILLPPWVVWHSLTGTLFNSSRSFQTDRGGVS